LNSSIQLTITVTFIVVVPSRVPFVRVIVEISDFRVQISDSFSVLTSRF